MAPKQYYFPYFFNLSSFNKALKSFGLSSYIKRNQKGIVESLVIVKRKLFQLWDSKYDLMEVPLGMTFMIHGNDLLFWETGNNSINIFKVNLEKLEERQEKLNEKIALSMLENCYGFKPVIELTGFVTYVRMEELKYETDIHEKFAVVIIEKSHIQIIPFDSFNKKGGDYGYVWPATAQFDLSTLQIHGQGMRMDDFTIDLRSISI